MRHPGKKPSLGNNNNHVFYCMLHVSTVNSHLLYVIHYDKTTEREIFVKELAHSLVLPQMKKTSVEARLPGELRLARVLGNDMPVPERL